MSVVRPMLYYAAGIWGSRLTQVQIQQLGSLQRQALDYMGNFRKGTPSEGINIIAGCEPVDLHIRRLVELTHTRILGHQTEKDQV